MAESRDDDEMDGLLRGAALRWQAQQPPAGEVRVDLLERSPRSLPARLPPWLAAGVAAAAVIAAVVAAGSLLSRDGSHSPASPTAASPTTASPTVPWADLVATRPHVRTTLAPDTGSGPDVVTPFDGITVAADLDREVRAGSTITFTVYLTAPEATPLDPCPDYQIAVGAEGGPRRSLNCAAVPYLDAAGVPYLPANEPVAFEMRLRVPDLRGEQKILWVVDGPQSLPGAHGVLTIRP